MLRVYMLVLFKLVREKKWYPLILLEIWRLSCFLVGVGRKEVQGDPVCVRDLSMASKE